MIICTIYNKKSFIEKINNHIVTMSIISIHNNKKVFEFTIDCFTDLPIEENIDITDQINDHFGASITGTIDELLKDDSIDSIYKEFIKKANELV